jgi:hypothetical protein
MIVGWCERSTDTQEETMKDVITKELVEELKKREGVEAYEAEPYQEKMITVNGPAIILVIVD